MLRKVLAIAMALCLISTLAFAESDFLTKADEYLSDGDLERALIAYSLAISECPDDPALLLRAAEAYQSAGETEKALSLVAQALAISECSDDPALFLRAAEVYQSAGETEKALSLVAQALAIRPAYGDAYLFRMRLTAKSDPAAAYQDMLYAEVLDVRPAASDYADLAAALYARGDAERACELFALSGEIARSDTYKAAYARALFAMGRATEAKEILGDEAAMDPQIAVVVNAQKTLALRETSVFAPETDYALIIPAHALLLEEFASIENEISAMGGVLQSDGGYRVPMTPVLMDAFMESREILSLSPDGSTTLFVVDSFIYALRNEQLVPMLKTEARGVADEYGNLDKMLSNSRFARSSGSVSWSPDGRYFTLTNATFSLVQAQFFIDLFIFDAETGEVFVGATYSNKMQDGGGTVIQTAFDATGRYVYYVLYGGKYDYRVSLMRYDMETNESVLCYNGPEFAAYPMLRFDRSGRLINIQDSNVSGDRSGLNAYTQTANGWKNDVISSNVPYALGYPKWMDYADVSDKGIFLRAVRDSAQDKLFSVFSMQDACAGLNQYLVIGSLDAERASLAELTEENLQAQSESDPSSDDSKTTDGFRGVLIHNAQLSPDGFYALLLASEDDTYRLLLLNLEDLSLTPIECGFQINAAAGFATNAYYPQGIHWASGTKILIGTEDGGKFDVKLMELCAE